MKAESVDAGQSGHDHLRYLGGIGMTIDDAKRAIQDKWQPTVETDFGCEAKIDDSLTVEESWGWVLRLTPVRREECKTKYPIKEYVFDRETGLSAPVGTKG